MNGRQWTKEDIDILTKMYPNHFASEIAEILGRKVRAVYDKALKLGLRSSSEIRSLSGKVGSQHPRSIENRFQAGHIPDNKGKKVSAEIYAKCAPTMFRKGHIPHNHKPVGTEGMRSDGYLWVKIADPDKWVQKQRLVWEQHHGTIPDGYNVQFKNRNPKDCRIENLYLISRADQMRNENSLIASYPKPLADLIRLKGVVNRQIHKQERNGK